MRWLVGDLQGCAREFDTLLSTINFDPARDELWCLGDLVNRGPDSLATVRLWLATGGRGVIGNHEVYTLCAASGRWPRKHDTLQSLYDAPDANELLATLRALPVLVWLPSEGRGPDVWAVHAGVSPTWTDLHAQAAAFDHGPHDDDWLEHPDLSFATRVRCCDAEGNRSRHHKAPDDCPEGYAPWDELYRGDAMVVHGHWAWRGHYRGEKSMGLDSACVYGGHLTAWCQDEDRIVQIPSTLR